MLKVVLEGDWTETRQRTAAASAAVTGMYKKKMK